MLYCAKTLRLRVPYFCRHKLLMSNDSSPLSQLLTTAMAITNGAIGAANPKTDKTLKLENVSDDFT